MAPQVQAEPLVLAVQQELVELQVQLEQVVLQELAELQEQQVLQEQQELVELQEQQVLQEQVEQDLIQFKILHLQEF